MIVVDVSVFAKLFLPEPDQQLAHELFRHSLENSVPILAPTVLFYEAFSVAIRHGIPFDLILDLFARFSELGLLLETPTRADMQRACDIATTGIRAAGYPGLIDSIYHAMAIERDCLFVTADERHVAKTRQFGTSSRLAIGVQRSAPAPLNPTPRPAAH